MSTDVFIPAVKLPSSRMFGCPFCGSNTVRMHDHLFPCPVCRIWHSTLGPTGRPECGGLKKYLSARYGLAA